MKHRYILSAVLLISCLRSFDACAQNTVQSSPINPIAIGVRASPDGAGVTARFFFNTHLAIEAQLAGSEGVYHQPDDAAPYGPSWSATGLLEYNILFRDPSWRIYAGGGLHFGKWDRYDHTDNERAQLPQGIFGFDAVFGGEYIFKSFPIGLSADIKPAVNVSSEAAFFPNNMIGVSARYYFGRRVVVRVE